MLKDEIEISGERSCIVYASLHITEDGGSMINIDSYNRSLFDKKCFGTNIYLCEKKVFIEIPTTKINVRGELVKDLEEQKQKELADHYMKMKEIQDKINSLLVIEYVGGDNDN